MSETEVVFGECVSQTPEIIELSQKLAETSMKLNGLLQGRLEDSMMFFVGGIVASTIVWLVSSSGNRQGESSGSRRDASALQPGLGSTGYQPRKSGNCRPVPPGKE